MDEPKTPKWIRLAGEQAEVFDKRSDTDREWFESHEGHVYFRPEIDGEWNEHIVLGDAIPTLDVKGYSKDAPKGHWTVVIDLGRAWDRLERKTGSPPSGMRTRVRINRPATGTTQADLDMPIMKYCLIMLHHMGYHKPDLRDSIKQTWDDGDVFMAGIDPNNPLGVNYGNKRTRKGFGK